jgi:hypothetical protein
MTTKRFFVKANYGNFSVVDINSGKMIVAYNTKRGADATSNGLNKIKTETALTKRIKSLKTMKGYGYFLSKLK